MKKLIASGFVLSTLLSTTPQICTLTTSTTNSKMHNVKDLQKLNLTPADIEYIEKYFNSKTEKEKQELKENLLSAIGLKNGSVVFDKTKLNQKMWDIKIYQIITSAEYLKTLNCYYQNKLLTFDVQGKAHFSFSLLKNFKIDGFWVETQWYWFGFCRLHLSSSAIEAFTEGGLSVTEIAVMISEACPLLIPGALVIAGVITANIFLIRSYDYGRGAWMGLYGTIIPTFIFGSD